MSRLRSLVFLSILLPYVWGLLLRTVKTYNLQTNCFYTKNNRTFLSEVTFFRRGSFGCFGRVLPSCQVAGMALRDIQTCSGKG